MTLDPYVKDKQDLEEYAELNGSTATRAITQEDGSMIVIESVQGQPCTQYTPSAEEQMNRWPPEVD